MVVVSACFSSFCCQDGRPPPRTFKCSNCGLRLRRASAGIHTSTNKEITSWGSVINGYTTQFSIGHLLQHLHICTNTKLHLCHPPVQDCSNHGDYARLLSPVAADLACPGPINPPSPTCRIGPPPKLETIPWRSWPKLQFPVCQSLSASSSIAGRFGCSPQKSTLDDTCWRPDCLSLVLLLQVDKPRLAGAGRHPVV